MSVASYCPYCASEDLWPQAEPQGAWTCRSCTRAFVVTKAKPEAQTTTSTTDQNIKEVLT